ncbi:hypothetical protein [Methanobacterium paludis]|uniref:Uncharacterized protein n=1 Tax=Methanobacterium paludis (strain DSM 25820 / JCM 18151 / SWAN1) TaxID=868131 RepID=F6D2V8_METPW|nr:hypothetical protein [Methanobacterium paludis]AEG18687.1 hypothetical protein MSWAN_1676 [Methanobacterium paludis]
MVEEFKESEGWMPVETDDEGRWTPKKMGDSIKGIYLTKKTSVGQYNSIVYVIKNEDGEFDVMGTTGLNNAFKKIPVGHEVAIIFKGEKPLKPPKNPYKIFKVYARKPGKDSKEDTKPETKQEKPEMNLEDDSKTWAVIDEISLKLEEKHEKINEKNITAMALKMRNDPTEDFTKEEFEDVKRVVKNINFD